MVRKRQSKTSSPLTFAVRMASHVDIATIGQYLRPTPAHLPVLRYVTPTEFAEYKSAGLAMGFTHVESGPLVRSSYHAAEAT